MIHLSLKTILITFICILLFGIYMGILLYGENSLSVLSQLEDKKKSLQAQEIALKKKNQKLQKQFFELKQFEPKGE